LPGAEAESRMIRVTIKLMAKRGYRKTHLWSCDIGVFSTGNSFDTCLWNGLRVGMLICYDVEFPEPARALGMLGTQLAIITDGNMDPYGPVHRRAGVARAMENQIFVAIVRP
jgi:(R)-amidase